MTKSLWQPTLTGSLIQLRPLQIQDLEELYLVGSDPLIWAMHPVPDRYTRERFELYFRSGIECGGALLISDLKTGEFIGSSRFTSFDATKSKVEVGYTFLACKYWGRGYNRELKRLMLSHAFQFVERVNFVVGEKNFRSQKAMEKIGGRIVDKITTAQLEGIVRTSFVYEIKKADFNL